MDKSCTQCSDLFHVSDEDLGCLRKLSPVFHGIKLDLSAPNLCPECRRTRRFSFRNDQYYYRNHCSGCDKSLISVYSPEKTFPILCEDCFWGDNWDPLAYGKDFDFSKTFFEQFLELRKRVPRIAVYHTLSENSDYTVHSSRNKNCYYGSSLISCEEVHYSDFVNRCQYSMDLFSCQNVELCYQCICCSDCYNSDFLENCSTLSDSYLCFDCRGGSLLVGCVSVRKQSNQILNRAASKQECLETIKKLNTDPVFARAFRAEFELLKNNTPHQALYNLNVENVQGNYLTNVKNAFDSFSVINGEDICHSAELLTVKDICDCNRVGYSEALYECTGIVELKFSAFCNLCYQSDNLLYCDNCQGGTSHCFGCLGLKRHSYCILNEQYTQEEYYALVPRIVEHMKATGEWGEFFPHSQSPFGFNETKAQESLYLSKEEALAVGLKWSEYEQPLPQGVSAVKRSELPYDITQVSNAILKQAIICEESQRPFKIVKPELEFYLNKGLPLPSQSPRSRHYERMRKLQPYSLFKKGCSACNKEIVTSHLPNDERDILCESCYLSNVY